MIAAHHRVMASKAFDWQMLNCVIESSEENGPCGGAVTTAVRSPSFLLLFPFVVLLFACLRFTDSSAVPTILHSY